MKAPALTVTPRVPPAWRHPAQAVLEDPCAEKFVKAKLWWAVSNGVPIRQWKFTCYWPGEPSGKGGGWSCANGERVKVGRIASAVVYWKAWAGHELWIQGYNDAYSGYARVCDNGPGWRDKYRFDLAAGSVEGVLCWEDGTAHGYRIVNCMVVGCPKPETCTCDFAAAWRTKRARDAQPKASPSPASSR